MHTFASTKAENVVFLFNGDLSGDVEIHIGNPYKTVVQEIKIPAAALVEFVMENYVKPQLIGYIEDASPDELIGMITGGLK